MVSIIYSLVDRVLVLGFILWLGARLFGVNGITFLKSLVAASVFFSPLLIASLLGRLISPILGLIMAVLSIGGTVWFLNFYLPLTWVHVLIVLGVWTAFVIVSNLIARRIKEEKEHQEVEEELRKVRQRSSLESRAPSSGSASSPIGVDPPRLPWR